MRERKARDAVRGLSEPRPNEAFRARLREEFTSGRIPERTAASRARPRRPRPSGGRLRRRLFLWIAAPAAAAAILFYVAGILDRDPHWKMTRATGSGNILFDGEPVPATDLETIGERLSPGVRLQLQEDCELDVLAPGRIALQITAGTEMTLPAVPGRIRNRKIEFDLREGEVRIVTGPGFHGAELTVYTPEAEVKVLGTTLAVIRDSVSTCVCSYDGCVFMAAKGSPVEEIPTGMRRFLYGDGRPPETLPIDDLENMKLQMFQEQGRAELERTE